MHLRNRKVALALVLTVALVLGMVGTAFASWSDLTSSILGDYGITESEVAQISDGYTDGSWKPYADMQRRQFVKMADDAYGITLVSPATPTYTDVPASDDYYPYVEGATAAGLVNGVGGGLFAPMDTITREQGAAIIARYVADANGFDLDTYYADPEAEYASFADAADVSDSLVKEMAFAVDFGIVKGNAFGNLDPQGTMTRIQGAAMLIRSWDILAEGEPVVPANIEQVTTDKAENLIGLTHEITFKVTQEDGSPAPGVLVDIDTLSDAWLVGNISSDAALTDENGEVSVSAISTEIGVQRVAATVGGSVATTVATKYWVAIDEVYIVDEDREARNNVGMAHDWSARVVVFGPGPLSTSRQDFYNTYNPDADPSAPKIADGEPVTINGYTTAQNNIPVGMKVRSLPGIPVNWSVVDVDGDPSTPSVGGIGDADVTVSSSVWESTDADGLTGVSVYSEETGKTQVTAVADYEGNPYPELMVNRNIYLESTPYVDADEDWEEQPGTEATATKTWIPHTFGNGDSPIDPAYTAANLNEQFTLTITLEDVYGNPVTDRQVEWYMQGVGWIVTDDDNTKGTGSDSVDVDYTDADGQARVFVKSDTPGEQIVEAKVRDKGTDGAEGQLGNYIAEVQWFDVDVATFDDPATTGADDDADTTAVDESNEAVAINPVGTSHDFVLNVYGLKLEYDSIDGQTPIIDTDALGNSYDGIFDSKDADYLGGVLLVNDADVGTVDITVNDGVVTKSSTGDYLGGYTEFDVNNDGFKEDFDGTTGIYLPLEGKDVTFAQSNGTADTSNLGADFTGLDTDAVGSFSPATDVTDENGQATVTVESDKKGPQTIEASVTWDEEVGTPELAYAKKLWGAQYEAGPSVSVQIDSAEVANNVDGKVSDWPVNSAYDADSVNGYGNAHIEVHVTDQYGNDLPDYEVVYLLESLQSTVSGDTYVPGAYFTDLDPTDNVVDDVTYDTTYDTNSLLPDHNEPVDADDPYAADVINTTSSGVEAFYFNQAAGPNWGAVDHTVDPTRTTGEEFEYLEADGAKAWTMDGYFRLPADTTVTPNLLTGSNVDVQLWENPANWETTGISQYKSIINVLVYAPQDGLATDTEPLWRFEVQKVWEKPVVDSIDLAPASDVNFASINNGSVDHTVTATLYDQFGELYTQDATVTFTWQQVEDDTTNSFTADVTTNDGTASYTATTALAPSVSAGAWDITAEYRDVVSNTATKYWASTDATITATATQTDLTVADGLGTDYNGESFEVVVDGNVVTTGIIYNDSAGTNVDTGWEFTADEEVFIHFPFSTRDDGLFDWFCVSSS